MDYQSLENLLPKANGSVYKLVRLAASRALELSEGKRSLVPSTPTDALTSVALKEIAIGRVVAKESSDQLAESTEEETTSKETES
ncbi:MAG TPA: DNA-directed RNA polymerase subunit omega [Candidatus Omnitrophota bacterium]|nr:DNA-directed RNA polymerase subunit omega [Candidatus Omnitrophota bacterium]HPN87938.1 DNA-directed RNA polymerase subunit omega [Candidatus Omnitrophota bacterium]